MGIEEAALELYQIAHDLHYKDDKIRDALGVYQKIWKEFPGTAGSKVSKTQIQNIAQRVIPENELIEILVQSSSEYLDVD